MNNDVDIMKTVAPKSDQLNADDLIGGAITVKVTGVSGNSDAQQPVSIHYEGDNGKPYKPCKSMRRVMIKGWTKNTKLYVGKYMTLYRDEKVKFGGVEVGGIRISHMSDTEGFTMALTETQKTRKPFTVKPLKGVPQTNAETSAPQIDPAVKKAGEDAAAKGVDAYTAWLATLAPDVKATVKPLHKDFSAKARAADEAKAKSEEEEDDEVNFDETPDASDDFDAVNGDEDDEAGM